MTGAIRRLAHDQSGTLRGVLVFLVIVVVIAAAGFDIVSLLTSRGRLSEEIQNAAQTAATKYVATQNDSEAQQAAQQYLTSRGATMHQFLPSHANGGADYTITASAQAHTYVLKYLTHLPWGIGDWVKRQITITATADNSNE